MAPWVFRNRLYGLPHDVHPVVLLYREDVYREAGIQFNLIETWEILLKPEGVSLNLIKVKDTPKDILLC